jgi:hypothetical protein
VSTYFQRNLYDDTYVAEDPSGSRRNTRRAVARMGLLIGWKAIRAQSDSSVKRYAKYALGWGSQFLYCVSPKAEMSVVGSLMTRNRVHENRLTGRFIKR